jgi:hypothetical protein
MRLEPEQAQLTLDRPLAESVWYRLKLRAQRVEDGVSVAGKVWPRDEPEPLDWQVVWLDTGRSDGPPLEGGWAGVQISGARALIDNLAISRNAGPKTAGALLAPAAE